MDEKENVIVDPVKETQVAWDTTIVTDESKISDEAKKKGDLSIALTQERQRTKELNDKIAKYEAAELAIEEKKKLEKWQHLDVIKSKEDLITQLKVKADLYDAYEIQKENSLKSELEQLESTISADIKSKYESILSDLSLEKKVNFYKTLGETLKKPDFSNNPTEEGRKLNVSDYEKAKAAWDIDWMLKYAPRIK